MKKQFLLLCLALIGIATYGQNSIPNGNFENWTTYSYDYPQNYPWNSNLAFSNYTAPNVIKTTDAYHGNFAVQITNSISNGDTAFGFIVNANPPGNLAQAHGGMPYNQKPTGIRGWYKYNQSEVDSGSIIVIFSKGGNNIGTYYFEIGGVKSSYTLFNKTFIPALATTPDSVIIGFLSCKFNAGMDNPHGIPGSTLILDSVSFTGVSSQPTWLNGDFESWQSQGLLTPDDWFVNNGYTNGAVGVSRTTDAAKGSYAIELTTYLGNNNNITEAQPSWISTGYYPNKCNNNCYEHGGNPFSNQTDTLVFYYKYAPAHLTDSARLNINFIKNHSQFDGRTVIILALSNYTYVEVPFSINQAPDTVIIDIYSSLWNDTAVSYVGADLKIDNIYFKSQISTGINQLTNGNAISVVPNPSNGKFQIKSSGINMQNLEICDILGKTIYSNAKFIQQNSKEIDLSRTSKGIYFVKVYDGSKIYVEKIIIR